LRKLHVEVNLPQSVISRRSRVCRWSRFCAARKCA